MAEMTGTGRATTSGHAAQRARAGAWQRSLSRRGSTVVVAGEQSLVADAVRAALTTRGHAVRPVNWPVNGVLAAPRGDGTGGPADVGLLISDLDRWSRVCAADLVLRRIETRWVVITTAPRGAAWGAVLDAGALTVLPAATGLDETNRVLAAVASGQAGMAPAERAALRRIWSEAQQERQVVRERLRSLTPREREVLRMLYSGRPVTVIAERLGISPATVRSQVKSVLRKLEVNTQLGAVATLGRMLRVDVEGSLPA